MKDLELDLYSDFHSNMEKGNQIINAKPSAIVATTKIQPEDLEEPEEGKRIFYS
jgi:hypothetical protein